MAKQNNKAPEYLIVDSAEFLNKTSREYGIYVVKSRQIPSICDGLKVSQRIALWLISDKATEIKTIALVGSMIESKLYVHGDASAGDTISFLAAPYKNNYPLIQGEGIFGTRTSPTDGIGAPRYTEVKRAKFSEKHLYVDMDILEMTPNYDNTVFYPASFLPYLPLVLLNGVTGVAVGYKSEILPRKLSDLQRAVIEVLETGKVQTKLMPFYENYDLDIVKSHEGPNKYIIKGKLEIKNTSTVLITELPPGKTLVKFKEFLIDLEEKGKIVDFVDRSSEKIDIEVKMRRASLEGMTEDRLIELFKLRDIVTELLVVVDPTGDKVVVYDSPEQLVEDFVKWRFAKYETRYQHWLEKEIQNGIYYLSLEACFNPNGLRPVPEIINKAKSKDDLKTRVTKAIESRSVDVIPENVEKIVCLPSYRWTKDSYTEVLAKIEEINANIAEYTDILEDEEKRRKIYLKEVKSLL